MSARLERLEFRRLLSTIAGTVYDDADSSGTFDPGETGIAGRTVYLDDNNDSTRDGGETALQTENDGTYIFLGLSAGTYHVRQIVPFGFDQTTPPNSQAIGVFLVNGQDVTDANFGTVAVPVITGSIAGTVYDDTNGDGVLDGVETGADARTVYLDDNNDGTLDAGETFTDTDASGSYMFDLLEIKSYNVRTVLPVGWRQTLPTNNAPLIITLTDGSRDATNANFLTTNKPVASVSGQVYNDQNRDGIQDTGEDGISGITVYLDANTNGALDAGELSDTTDNSGNYAFVNIDVGTYEINQVLQANWLQTFPVADQPQLVTLIADDDVTDVNFGTATIPGSITGTVYDDTNGDGVQDSGENGVEGRTVYIDADNDGTFDNTETFTTTDTTGLYTFDELDIASYKVRTVLPQGWQQTLPANGAAQTVTLTDVDRDLTGIDFLTVFKPVGTVSGTIFNDRNRNGVKDAGDNGVSGIIVYIDTNNNRRREGSEPTRTTNGSGAYTFANIDVGTYSIRQILQKNWIQTVPVLNQSRVVTLVVDDNMTDVDFGTAPIPASIAGMVFDDGDADGIRDPGEKGVSGVQVYIDSNRNGSLDGGEPSFTTTGGGTYVFTNLDPGSYLVRVVIPTDYRITTASFYDRTIIAAQKLKGLDFGLTGRGSISGSIFNDSNTSRTRDAGEVGLRGWKVYLDQNTNGRFDAGEVFVTSDAQGDFKFDNLLAGTYQIRVVQFSKYKLTTPILGYYTSALAANGANGGLLFGQKIV